MPETETETATEMVTLTVEIDVYIVDSRGVLPDPMDIGRWQDNLVEMIDEIPGVPVCTDNSHELNGEVYICGQHVTQMEDSEWRIGRMEVLRAKHGDRIKNMFTPERRPYSV